MLNKSLKTQETLSKYFTIVDKTATVRLNFDTFSELIDQNWGDDSVERLNGTLSEKLSEAFHLIPRKYEIKVDIYIRDYGDYTPEEAERIIKDNIRLFIHALLLERNRKRRMGWSLLGGGVVLLLFSYFLDKTSLPAIFFDVMNISGTLLVWEAADITLIERGEDAKRARQYINKLKGIRLLQG